MTDLRKIGYAGVELNLGGPHTHPSVGEARGADCESGPSESGPVPSPTDYAREAADRTSDPDGNYPIIQQAIDAATAELDEAATETLAEVMQERDFKDAEIERLKRTVSDLYRVKDAYAIENTELLDRIADKETT